MNNASVNILALATTASNNADVLELTAPNLSEPSQKLLEQSVKALRDLSVQLVEEWLESRPVDLEK